MRESWSAGRGSEEARKRYVTRATRSWPVCTVGQRESGLTGFHLGQGALQPGLGVAGKLTEVAVVRELRH